MQSHDHLTVVLLKRLFKDFTGDPVVKIPYSQCRNMGSTPGQARSYTLPSEANK